MELHQTLRSFCTAKEMITRIKRHPVDWEKIFVHHNLTKVHIAELYKKNPVSPVKKKWEDVMNKKKSQGIQITEQHMKILYHLGNANQSCNMISHTMRCTKNENKWLLMWMWGKGDPHSLLVGMLTSSVFMKSNMDTSQKTRNWTSI